MNKKNYVLILSLGILCLGSVSSYAPNAWDVEVMDRIDSSLQVVADTGGKERMFYLTTRIEELAEETTDERILAFLEYIMRGLDGHMQRLFSLPLVWTPYTTLESPVLVEYVTSPSEDAPEGAVTAPVATTTNVPSSTELLALEDFYQTYKGRVTSDAPLSDLCIAYFDEIDAVAKRYDFPTSLIIATWFREHTCIFENPANTRGNFQITSHRYPAGSISWSDFENQIINFITFSQGKWEYYDNVQTYGPAPITLSYDTIDLASLRKHAIFYNGITSTLEENIYANQNFGSSSNGRDGIVAMTLRALEWQLYGTRSADLGSSVGTTASASVEDAADEDTEEVVAVDSNGCSEVFTEDLGPEATHMQVAKMQAFLADQGLYAGTPNGVYDDKTIEAVNAFQAFYKADILDPGGYDAPTGYRYPATRRKANALSCE